MEMQLPFLITTLVGHNKQISGIVSSHVQWLEKLLADVEKVLLVREASNKKSNHAQELKELKCIYILLKPWNRYPIPFLKLMLNQVSHALLHSLIVLQL